MSQNSQIPSFRPTVLQSPSDICIKCKKVPHENDYEGQFSVLPLSVMFKNIVREKKFLKSRPDSIFMLIYNNVVYF